MKPTRLGCCPICYRKSLVSRSCDDCRRLRARLFGGTGQNDPAPNQRGRAARVAALADRASRRADLWADGLPDMETGRVTTAAA